MGEITKDNINGLIETIQELYLADEIPWMIGYSGGKDSTAAVQLVWMAIEQLPSVLWRKTIHIMNTDTLVESPVVSKWVEKSLVAMKKTADEKGLPFKPVRLTPDFSDTFWVNLIGKGYPFPRQKYRWCTDRLKIKPVNTFIKSKIAEHGEIILVLGTRKAESARRARTMAYYEKKRVRELLSPNPTLANELVFSPMEAWSNDDVWVFLMQYPNPWGYSNQDLLTMYRGASEDNECPIMTDKDMPTCGKSRFGCWVCTMVERDKSMAAMIANDEEKAWMSPLMEFRNYFGDLEQDRERRSYRRMNGALQGNYGRLFHGPYKKGVREDWLRRLLEMQKDINENGPEEFAYLELITIEELREIRRIWVERKHEFDDSLPRIYEEVLGKEFHDPTWIGSSSFGKEEWDILGETCRDLYTDEDLAFEMLYSLIDVENKGNSITNRKGIVNDLEKVIKTSFYKNEEDALGYYRRKQEREKEYGGSYNEKFFYTLKEQFEQYTANEESEEEEYDN